MDGSKAKETFVASEIRKLFRVRLSFGVYLLTVRDIPKGPFHNSELDDAGPQCCNDLRKEHNALGNLEIVSEFQVIEEGVSLVHRDVAVCLE